MADASFNNKRLILARNRRGMTAKALAEETGLAANTISRLENGLNDPDTDTIKKLATALRYPHQFFLGDDPEFLDSEAVSFRSLSKMASKERNAALAGGALGLQLSEWVEQRFQLPEPNLIDLSYETDPEAAAIALRQHWGIGEKPIGNMIGLLETNGVRVFSLAEQTKNVDAFSFWKSQKPFVFLNTYKTAEHSIFDAAHELGHLVLHMHGGPEESQQAEREANAFASAFLVPAADVKARMPRLIDVNIIIRAKLRWRVSAMAMAYRLRRLGLLTEWQYKSACIELGKRGYRSGEPEGIERETSSVWHKILERLWTERVTKDEIAQNLCVPVDEIDCLLDGVMRTRNSPPLRNTVTLSAVK
ncbi:helix-turn-helix domain-containing protein [Thalassospira xiamenensis]|uniref:Zn-dependent peptidase ImmA, M78 family n=1 Tax=Thalassospira xiamenensis TaxID=220697 RepID=A0A285RLG6_9PROT|nr:XRE family transcriptional regulator [Thalassospira xiamenensis]SOB94568.1 Zn-dependent peptidase ImmA, M78 family [Thalassospira xiamenensis]